MARVTFRPATRADFERLIGAGPAHRVYAYGAWLEDDLLGLAGLIYMPDGTVWTSAIITPEFRRYPAAILRGGRALMSVVRRMKIRRLLAMADETQPAAECFLGRLGFERREIAGVTVFVWDHV